MTHITSHRRSGKPWRSIMAAIATAAMALSPGAAAYAADADATAPATTASANLRGAWNFENTAAGDREAANNGGSSSATAQLIGDDISIIADPAGVFGNVLHFGAGASSYMKINQYVNTGAGNASFAMWYRYDTTLDPTGDKPAVLLQQDGAGRSLLTLRPSNQYHTYVNATDVLSNNTVARGGWQHIAVSFDQTSRKVKFYVNGALDSEKNMGTSAVNAVTALLVGSHKNIGTMDPHSMKGDVDDIRVYDATLTDDQAAAIYAEQGTALVRKQLGTLVSQADALLAAGEVDAASAQAQALATAKRNAVNAMDNTSGSAAARMTAMNAAGTALQTAITAYQAHVPITLTADPSTVERTVDSASIFGVNHRYAFNGYGSFDPDTMRVKDDFTALYKQVGFGSIRYPGGTISNLFNWKTTIGPRAQRLKQMHGFYNNPGQGGIEPNFGIGEIATFADEVDSEIVYVYSLGRGNAQDAADLIEYLNAQVGTNPNGGIDWAKVRADNGHPQPYNVRYFEIGNEMNQAWANSDGTASQGYWTTAVSGGSEQAYTEGGTASFTKQYAVSLEDWNKAASVSDGKAGLTRYMRYANVNPKMNGDDGAIVDDPSFVAVNKGSVSVWVGNDQSNEQWRIVDDLETAGAGDKVVQVDYSTGALRFGDGVHGAIPAKGQQVYVSYTVDRDGFVKISKAIKNTTDQINTAEQRTDGTRHTANVYTSYESTGFITRMANLNANQWYDGMTIHPYSGTPTGATAGAWYDDAMKKAETAGVNRVKEYVRLMPAGKVPVISEYGIFRDTSALVRSQSHALYIAKVALEYVRLGSPYIQKHCLIDWYSSGADSLGPTQQAVIQAVPEDGASTVTGEGRFGFFLTPSAYALQMLGNGIGDSVLTSTLGSTPTLGNGATALSALVSKDDDGNLRVIIVNLDRALGRTLKLNFGQDLSGRVADVQTMDAAINAENTLENQDNVTPVDSSVTFDTATPTVTVTPHSLTTLKIRPRAAGTINAAPVITASDRTITVGDAFDPLDGVTAHDAEDGDMPLAAANVTADDVDPDTPGTYHVTITVTDSQGATTSKTFTVVVQAKEGGETPEPEPDPSPGPEPTPEPAPKPAPDEKTDQAAHQKPDDKTNGQQADNGKTKLSHTGASVLVALTCTAMLAIGGGLIATFRRKRS